MTDCTIRICSLRAADGGARLVMNIEISTPTGTEKQVLSPLVSRLKALPVVGFITEETLSFYRDEDLFADALTRAYRYLSGAGCSLAAMQRKLRAAGVAGEQAKQVVEHLIATSMLDERKSALREAEKSVAKLWGDRRILAALRAKGYGAQALAAVTSYLRAQDGAARCARLIEMRRMVLPADEPSAARFAAALVRYGYTGREIKAAMRLLRSEQMP